VEYTRVKWPIYPKGTLLWPNQMAGPKPPFKFPPGNISRRWRAIYRKGRFNSRPKQKFSWNTRKNPDWGSQGPNRAFSWALKTWAPTPKGNWNFGALPPKGGFLPPNFFRANQCSPFRVARKNPCVYLREGPS